MMKRAIIILLISALVLSGVSSHTINARRTTALQYEDDVRKDQIHSINSEQQQQQQISVLNQQPRPTQFIEQSLKLTQSASHSNNGLILPANNAILTNGLQPRHTHQSPSYESISPSFVLPKHSLVEQQPNIHTTSSPQNINPRQDPSGSVQAIDLSRPNNLSLVETTTSTLSHHGSEELRTSGQISKQRVLDQYGTSSNQHSSQQIGPQHIDDKSQVSNQIHESNGSLNQLHGPNEIGSTIGDKQNHRLPDTNSYITEASSASNSTTEISNNVLYEPPSLHGSSISSSNGEFYFSASSERLPENDKDPNAWWAIGFGHQYEIASNLTRENYLEYCSKSEFLVSNRQRSLCRSHWMVMPIVARGLKMAIDECQSRFSTSRWNCTLVLHNSIKNDQRVSPKSNIFGDVMKHPVREKSFLNAIFAASLAHAMTKACSQGELPEECSCDKKIRSRNNRGEIEWIACSDDIDYGSKFSRDFTDDSDSGSEGLISMINLHNYEAGRRVFKSATDITCTCQNGDNGLCTTKRCWKHLAPFTDISDELMRRYEGATHVQPSNRDPHKLRPVRRGVRRPKRKDLVYIDESPDYCTPNSRLGITGTQNRHCNSTSSGPDSCSLLCCGRGYQVVVEEFEEDCNCQFFYCCRVVCDKCKRQEVHDVCN